MVIFLIVSGITFAQERGGGARPSKTAPQGVQGNRGDRQRMSPEERNAQQTKRLVEELKLTKEQELKVTAINKKYSEKQTFDWSKMRDASEADRTKMRETMTKVQADKDKEIKTILTADQLKLYDEMLKKRAEARKNGQGRMGGQGAPGR